MEKTKKRKRRARAPKPRGRPPHVPDEKLRGVVEALAAFGFGVEKIAAYVDLAPHTVRKHYGKTLDKARPKLFGAAVSGLAVALGRAEGWAIKYVLSCHGRDFGWAEHSEHSGPGGGSIPVRLSSLNDNQLAQLLVRLELLATSTPAALPG